MTTSRQSGAAQSDRLAVVEWLTCSESFLYFCDHYCQVKDEQAKDWVPFRLWPAQVPIAKALVDELLIIILKARQLGMTWLVLAYALWLMLFRPASTVLLFSKRDDEAIVLLDERLKGMYRRLPAWMHARAVEKDNGHVWMLSNGSVAYAFPTTGGDSYTASLAIVDEADLLPDLGKLMTSVKPTIDAGGQMILLSRVDKSKPLSEFKQIYRGAKEHLNGWLAIFLPWMARPSRTAAWYGAQKADVQYRTGALDDLLEQYPATDTEALGARTLDKRIAPVWLENCYQALKPLPYVKGADRPAPAIPGLMVYRRPAPGARYVLGADPAEGNPTSDDSALIVLEDAGGEEVAKLAGHFQPAVFASYIDQVGTYFNDAAALVERNNHGHAVILWLKDNSALTLLDGHDGKPGWLSSSKGKTLLYDTAADAFREGDTTIHSLDLFTQLSSIEGSTLLAPEGQHDDLADAAALALVARTLKAGNQSSWGDSPTEDYRGG